MQLGKFNIRHPAGVKAEPSAISIAQVRAQLVDRISKQYSTSQAFLARKFIEDLVEKKEGDQCCINFQEIKWEDGKQHLQKYCEREEGQQTIRELLQYYKYYSQEAICFVNRQFCFLTAYHEKKKAILYEQLKRQLNISDSQTLQQMSKAKSPLKFKNVLLELTVNNSEGESYLLQDMLKKLVNHFGPSRTKTLNKIDCEFKFMPRNVAIGKSRKKQSMGVGNFKTVLESTNTSMRNQAAGRSEKKIERRRYGSCELLKASYLKPGPALHKQKEKNIIRGSNLGREKSRQIERKPSHNRRRKSTELTSNFESHLVSTQFSSTYKKQAFRTEASGVDNSKICESNFRKKMEQVKTKIRNQKEKLAKKQDPGLASRKKLRKA